MTVVSLRSSPLQVLKYFFLYILNLLKSVASFAKRHLYILATFICMSAVIFYIYLVDGRRRESILAVESAVIWYLWWMLLGVASSIGLGTGLHTFVLFLGPHIAHVTLTAYKCKNLNFSTRGDSSFSCTGAIDTITIPLIYQKIILESFFWGAGTALGELPPYFVARAGSFSITKAATAGSDDDQIQGIEKLMKIPYRKRSISDTVQILMYNLLQRLGFFGILIAASIPNPLFDLAGIICGHFGVPFGTFFGATFIGKAIIKSSIQSVFIIMSFSQNFLDFFLEKLSKVSPWVHDVVIDLMESQADRFSSKTVSPPSFLSQIWNLIMLGMISYFVLSTIEALANSEMKKVEQNSISNSERTSKKVPRKSVSAKRNKNKQM